jgi:hypothetical protein
VLLFLPSWWFGNYRGRYLGFYFIILGHLLRNRGDWSRFVLKAIQSARSLIELITKVGVGVIGNKK